MHTAQPPETGYDWLPFPQSLQSVPQPQAEHPAVPGAVGEVIDVVHRLSVCSRPTAGLLANVALSALAAEDWNAKTMAPDPKFLSLHVAAMSRSIWRKSTAVRVISHPLQIADGEVEARWISTRASYESKPRSRDGSALLWGCRIEGADSSFIPTCNRCRNMARVANVEGLSNDSHITERLSRGTRGGAPVEVFGPDAGAGRHGCRPSVSGLGERK